MGDFFLLWPFSWHEIFCIGLESGYAMHIYLAFPMFFIVDDIFKTYRFFLCWTYCGGLVKFRRFASRRGNKFWQLFELHWGRSKPCHCDICKSYLFSSSSGCSMFSSHYHLSNIRWEENMFHFMLMDRASYLNALSLSALFIWLGLQSWRAVSLSLWDEIFFNFILNLNFENENAESIHKMFVARKAHYHGGRSPILICINSAHTDYLIEEHVM